jgi:hypothetical protein
MAVECISRPQSYSEICGDNLDSSSLKVDGRRKRSQWTSNVGNQIMIAVQRGLGIMGIVYVMYMAVYANDSNILVFNNF